MNKILLFFILPSIIFCQIKLSDKEYKLNSITYIIEIGDENIQNLDKSNIEFIDESKPGEIYLPAHELFFAVPVNSQPKLKYTIIDQKELKAYLSPNPIVNYFDGELKYSKSESIIIKKQNIIVNKGFLWLGNNYCIHVQLNPYTVISKSKLNKINKIKIEISFDKPIPHKKNIENSISKFIIDKEFASNVIGNQNYKVGDSDSWIDYNKNYLKLGIGSDGIYRLTYKDLDSMGISLSNINPKSFKIYSRGKQIPIYVEGEENLIFEENEFIEFPAERNYEGKHRIVNNFNEPYNEYLNQYSDTTIYWLTWDGENGKRVLVQSKFSIIPIDTLSYYHQIDHYEKNVWFDFSSNNIVSRELPEHLGNKTWHEGNLGVGTHKKYFSTSDFVLNSSFNTFVKLQDYASDISDSSHLLSLGINSLNNWGDSVSLNKYQQVVLNQSFSTNLLKDDNTLDIKSLPTNASINTCIFDWYEIEYPRYLIPFDDSLKFTFPYLTARSPKAVEIQNIFANQISLWKYGNTYKKYSYVPSSNKIVFSDTISASDKFLLSGENKIKKPKIYYKKQFINLRNTTNRADYIAITHKKFLNKVSEYKNFIEDSYNVDAKVLDIDDIYDEFSFGFFNPEAIKDFLKTTHTNWQNPKPKYVFLIGGATYDYYGYKYQNLSSVTERVFNYVPSFGTPVSDNWFVIWDTTGAFIPQMNIGRIPVTSNEQLSHYLQKHRDYVTQEYSDWNKKYLFFSSGDAANSSELSLLRAANQYVIDNFASQNPIGGKIHHFYKTDNPKTNFGPYSESYFQNAINEGGLVISYIGHSGTQIWDNSITEPSQLMNNVSRYPMVSDFGCSTGKFAEPDITSFSELFTLGNDGQAIAYLGNSSLGFISTSTIFPKIFYKKILEEKVLNISQAHIAAKLELLNTYGSSGTYELFAYTNSLIGDPIISLPIPQKINLSIESKNIKIMPEVVTDLDDSVNISFNIFNFGESIDTNFTIKIIRQSNKVTDTLYLVEKLPKYSDSLSVNLPINGIVGENDVSVLLDPDNKFDELDELDNETEISFVVASSAIRPVLDYSNENGVKSLHFLNPTNLISNENLQVEFSENNQFYNPTIIHSELDTIFTRIELKNLDADKRYWFRTKLQNLNDYSKKYSFTIDSSKYIIYDSVSYSTLKIDGLKINHNGLTIDSVNVSFDLFSAGFEDGQSAIISRDGIDYIPTPRVGHHVVLFNAIPPYEYIKYLYFDTYSGGENITNYYSFLDTLSNNFLVAIAISDEGRIRDNNLKELIRSLGSAYIDSVKFRSSWFILGRKGADIGSVPEQFSLAGNGSVQAKITKSYLSKNGSFTTSKIGPSKNWERVFVNDSVSNPNKINYYTIGISQSGREDTLSSLSINNKVGSLKNIDAESYPYLRILGVLENIDNTKSPVLKSIKVNYTGIPELAINYQVVSLEQDTVDQGEDVNLSFFIYNVGESTADSFNVKVELVNSDNSKEKIFEELVDSISSESRRKFNIAYNTANFSGRRTFFISIDDENKVTELFEDNNYYSIPFYVVGDTTKPSLQVTVDGNEIFDGEYISPTPQIKVELTDESLVPITDTASVSIYLNNRYINYLNNSDELEINYSASNPKVTVNYNPILEDGEYTLRVFGKDATGNISDSAGIRKNFVVESKPKILSVYNYPNPFANDTYFTFKLTQIPDELKIKIFTVAGRLVKTINLNNAELNYDLNKIYWDGKDEDGDKLGNGVYLYKVIMKINNKKIDVTQKLAIVR